MADHPSGRAGWARLARIGGLLALIWIGVGVRHLDADEFGVLSGPLAAGRSFHVSGRWAVAPPGLLRLTTYPRRGVELPLPQAAQVMLAAADGSRFGFRGWITVRAREEEWEKLHLAADGRGVEGALLAAVREAAAGFDPRQRNNALPPTALRDIEARLTESLASRGVDLRRFELDSIDFLAVSGGEIAPTADTRLLVVGLDGGDWEIIDSLLARGKLPNLGRLIDDGARAKLLSISPMLSPVIWTTIATGVEPSRHGILDFLVEDPQDGSKQPVTSAQRTAPTFWEMLSRSGVDVGVVGWWASWPADPVRGFLVSDRLAYQLFGFRADPEDAQGKTWPPGLYDDIRPSIVSPDSVGWDRVRPFLEGSRLELEDFDDDERKILDEFRTLLASGETYLGIAESLRERFAPQLEAVYLEGTDTVGHLFMPYRPPPLPGVDLGRQESFSAIVDRYYELADGYLGRLLEDRDGWTVMIVSDHGFASDATRPRSTESRIGHGAAADWHRRFGILVLSGAHVRPGVRIEEASVYDIAPTVMALFGQPVPRAWPGRVLGSALEASFLEAHPVRYSLEDPARRDVASEGLIDPAAADLLQKLQSLGYIASGAEGSDSLTARNNAGVALLAEGRFADAEREFQAGLEATPGSPMLQVNLAIALRLQGRSDQAAKLLEQALDHPSTLRMAGQVLGQIRLERSDLDGAESIVRRVLDAEPDASEVRNTLGLILEKRGDLDGARDEFLRAAELDPDAALARSNLGNLAKRRGELERAERWYEQAIEADPYFMGAYNNLALVYQEQGRMDEAIDLYGRALGKSPNNAVVLNNLASLYYATGDHDEAYRLWSRAAAADPFYPSPLNNLASLEINAQRLGEAERLLRRALELDPEYGDARINLSLVLRGRGEPEAARAELRRATKDPRTRANGWMQLGFFELEQGRLIEAIEALEQARQRAPQDTDVLNALGEAHFRSGARQRALELWRRSIELNPGQPRLEQVLAEQSPG